MKFDKNYACKILITSGFQPIGNRSLLVKFNTPKNLPNFQPCKRIDIP